ncbi:MAG: RelA/SpoT family protein [Dehalococcoidia bacterium]
MDLSDLIAKTSEYLPPARVSVIQEAYQFAACAHDGQNRFSGEPYIQHPMHTAMTVAELQLDATAVAAALLHDVQEDCGVANEELAQRFGPEVARLVEGVTKLGRIPWQTPEVRVGDEEMQAENLRKMFLAMAEDLRVVIIKLADRLHNMRTLDALPPEDCIRIAGETMEIYGPLAGRLGIWDIKWRLEDLAFRHLQPERYHEIAQMLDATRDARERYIAQVEEILRQELAKRGVAAEVRGRAKHIYSIHQKVQRYSQQGRSVDEIYDLLAIRILVDTVADCYNALGVVHSLWRPIPGTFDDYIAAPKESVYQSLHTTVMCLGARPVEVQIRTHEMHRLAEYGVAAHWRYKEGKRQDLRYEERLAWLRQLLEWQREMSGAAEFVESVKTDIFRDQVFVYTPKGEIKDLPAGATPIDFAYRIHTDLGHRCIGAKVNGRLVPLNYQLQNGDLVEIIPAKTERGPSRDWLNTNLGYVRTSHAREKVRQWFRRQERAENMTKGREMLEKGLRRLGLSLAGCQRELLQTFKYENLEDLLVAIGSGEISTHQVALKMAAPLQPAAEGPPPSSATAPRIGLPGIQVLGTGGLLTRLANCCDPVPGAPIIGYVTRGSGVTVHRRDCYNVLHTPERERLIDVEWGHKGQTYPVAVRIEAWDRVGLLRDISILVAEERVNMVGIHTQEHSDGTISIFVTLEITGIEQLTRLLDKVEMVRSVISVGRRLEGTSG